MKASNYYSELAGIIGGIGPEATAYFQQLLVKIGHEKAKKDQDHIPYLLYNNPQIPDRSEHIVYGKENPLPELVHTGTILKSAGASFLAMLCNTSHIYADQLEDLTGLSVINMIEITAGFVKYAFGSDVKVGLLATNGTVMSNLYQDEFAKIDRKIQVLTPDSKTQKEVMNAVYNIKSVSVNAKNTKILKNAAQKLIKDGAEVIILGCTEIPLALGSTDLGVEKIDPMEILAREIVAKTSSSKLSLPTHFWQFYLAPQR